MKVTHLLLSLLGLSTVNSERSKICRSQTDCNDMENEIVCGFCAEATTSEPARCVLPFKHRSDTRCTIDLDCEDDCSGAGSCVTADGNGLDRMIPSCQCKDGFYGWKCEHSDTSLGHLKEVLFRKLDLPFESKVYVVTVQKRVVNLLCGTTEDKSTGYLEVISGDEEQYERVFLSRESCRYKGSIFQAFTIRFGYKPLSDNTVLKLRNDVLGYISSFKIRVTLGSIVNFEHDFPVIIDYTRSSLKCVPVIELYGCGSSKSNEIIIRRSQKVTIVSSVYFIADGRLVSTSVPKHECENNADYKWKIWKDVDTNINITYKSYYAVKTLEYDNYILKIGKYRILLEVVLAQEPSSTNYAYCHLNVKFEPFIAIIDGGSERVVLKKFGLILRSTQSKDPNQPINNQRHMKVSWSCVDKSNTKQEICDPYKTLPLKSRFVVPSRKLQFGTEYEIKLRVWTDDKTCFEEYGRKICEAFAFAKILVANKSDEGDEEISVQCLLNCKEKVVNTQLLYLRVKSRYKVRPDNCIWTYYEGNQVNEKSADLIRDIRYPDCFFVTKENVFTSGKRYTIVVRIPNKNMLAKHSFETNDVKFEGNCSIEPMSGLKGLTTFDIICQNYSSNGPSFIFEFYDKKIGEVNDSFIFSGRMLGSSESGQLRRFRVTRGHVLVYIKDKSGIYTNVHFDVNISQGDVEEKIIYEILHNITRSRDQSRFEEMLQYLSILPDIVPMNFNKTKVYHEVLQFIIGLPTNTLSDVKIVLSTIYNVIVAFNKPINLKMGPNLMKNVLHFTQTGAYFLRDTVATDTDLHGMTSKEIIHISTVLLTTCLHATLNNKKRNTTGVGEFDLDFETEEHLLHTSAYFEDILHSTQDILTFLQRPGLFPIQIITPDNSTVLLVAIDDEDYNLTNYFSNSKPVSITRGFLHQFRESIKQAYDLALRVATFDDNIFLWRGSDIKSNLVSVSLVKYSYKQRALNNVKFVRNPLDIQITFNRNLLGTTVISDATFIQNNNYDRCSLDLDLLIKIHRLDPAPQSLIKLRFRYPETNGSLLVWLTKTYRPDCENIKEKATMITADSPNYQPVVVKQNEPTFYYIGIIPAPGNRNDSVRYTFEVNTTICQHWMFGQWRTEGCTINKDKTCEFSVHCSCDEFSTFAAAFPVPPQEVDPFLEISLFLTVFDNPIVVIFVTIVLLLYLIACIWAWRTDKRDRNLKRVIVLEDNFPGDRHPYLLAVFTSSRFNAGTTAHVGLKIIGSSATSRAHILSSPERKVLKRNYDDWFLLYCSEYLGEIKCIHIWHDNAGSSPDWFCDKIVVFDLKYRTDVVFIVEEWLALKKDLYSEAMISVASISDVKNVKRMFVDNCVQGMREGHVLLSIMFRHPRSEITRLTKISILMCFTMVAMLCSIMWFDSEVDANEYNVSSRELLISISSMIISVTIAFIILVAFKNSYKYVYDKTLSTTFYKSTDSGEYNQSVNTHKLKRKTFYSNYIRFVSKRLKGHPLLPVQLPYSKSTVQRKTKCFLMAWLSCIGVIIICSYFVMLYGLKLGSTKSKMWLSCVFLTLSEEVLILGPAKIFILAIIFSMAFQTWTETHSHQVNAKDALNIKMPDDDIEKYQKLCVNRNQSMYAPLKSDVIDKMIRKQLLRSNWWNVIDFSVSLCFIIILNVVVFYLWSSYYLTNNHVKNVISPSRNPTRSSEHFELIKSISWMDNYLRETFVRSLYTSFWYNKQPIVEEGLRRGFWANDYTLRSIGFKRLRQIRVTPVSCKSKKYVNTSRLCVPKWDREHEDTEDYGVGWTVAEWHDVEANNSPWKYTQPSSAAVYTTYRLRGESGTLYHNGGYLTHLGPDRMAAERSVHDVINHRWQDQLTSALFLEFILYNVDSNVLSKVTIIVEYLIPGNTQVRTRVVSVASKMMLSAWEVSLVAFIIYYVALCGYLINRQGLIQFMASSLNSTLVFIVFLSVLCFFLAGVHFFNSSDELKDFVRSGQISYFDFDAFILYFLWFQRFLSLLIVFAILRLVMFFVGGRSLMNYFNTLRIATSCTLWLSLVVILFLLFQLHWMLSLNIYYFDSVLEVIINPKYFVKELHAGTFTKIFFLAKSVLFKFMIMFLILVYIYSYKVARTCKLKKYHENNVITFILKEGRRRLSNQRRGIMKFLSKNYSLNKSISVQE